MLFFFSVSLSSQLIPLLSQALSDFPHKCGSAEKHQRLDTWSGLRELRTAGKIRAWLGNVDGVKIDGGLANPRGNKMASNAYVNTELNRCNSILLVMVARHILIRHVVVSGLRWIAGPNKMKWCLENVITILLCHLRFWKTQDWCEQLHGWASPRSHPSFQRSSSCEPGALHIKRHVQLRKIKETIYIDIDIYSTRI